MYLKDNFETIKNAIVETWSSKKGITLENLEYHDNNQEIFGQITYHGNSYNLRYKEVNHAKPTSEESLDSFLDDLNSDLAFVDILDRFPNLGIQSLSWGSKLVKLYDGLSFQTLDKFFSPKTGIFNFDIFFTEKCKALEKENANLGLMMFGNRSVMRGAASETSDYPHTYESQLVIKPNMLYKPQ